MWHSIQITLLKILMGMFAFGMIGCGLLTIITFFEDIETIFTKASEVQQPIAQPKPEKLASVEQVLGTR
jgi:hypothetical protein